MYTCVYLCVYVYLACVCIYTYVYESMAVRQTSPNARHTPHAYICTFIHTQTHTHKHARTHLHTLSHCHLLFPPSLSPSFSRKQYQRYCHLRHRISSLELLVCSSAVSLRHTCQKTHPHTKRDLCIPG